MATFQPKPIAPAPQPRMAGDDRRRQLIEVAIDLFSRRGFAGTTTKEIALAAGVTEAIIFRHFATKQDLYKAILDYKCGGKGPDDRFATAEALMEAEDDPAFFRFVITSIIGFYREYPQFERLLIHAALEGHELAIMHQQQISTTIGLLLTAYITKRQAAGALLCCSPAAILFALAGVPKFYAMQKYIFHLGEAAHNDDEMIESFVNILMNGLQPK